MTKWRKVRIGIFIFTFITGVFSTLNKSSVQPFKLEWFELLMPLIFFPIVIPLLIGAQSKAPYINEKWEPPTLDTNFFTLGDPLHFFHLGGFVFLIGGIANVIVSVVERHNLMESIMLLSSGVGVLIGVKICSKICSFKY